MPDARNEKNRGLESGATPHEIKNVRKPYRAPHLRYLGSVKELTAGARNGRTDGSGRKPPGM
jgi:hypothetical protein